MGEGNNGVSTGIIIFSLPSPSWVSHAPSLPCACFCLPKKREKNNSCCAGCRKTGKFYWAPVTTDCLLYLPSTIFIPTFQPKKKEPSLQTGNKKSQALIGQCIFFDHTYIFITLLYI